MASETNQQNGWFALVCGSLEMNDNSMIGDFAGLMYYIRNDFGIEKDFVTAIDLNKYVKESRFEDIKFGRGGEEVVVYNRWKADNRAPTYTYIAPADLKGWFEDWIDEVSGKAVDGDYVTIIIITHGNPYGEMRFGSNRVNQAEMEAYLGKFADGVEVNVMTNACHSGILSDTIRSSGQSHRYIQASCRPGEKSFAAGQAGWLRQRRSTSGRYRDFYFTESLVKSLLKIGDKVPPKEAQGYKLRDHLTELRLGTHEKPPKKSSPYMFSDWYTSHTLFQVLHLDFVKIRQKREKNNNANTSRRLVIPTPAGISKATARPTPPVVPDPSTGCLLDIIRGEAKEVEEEDCSVQDQALWQQLDDLSTGRDKLTTEKIVDGFTKLYWRIAVQDVVFDALMFLGDQLLIDPCLGFMKPMELDSIDKTALQIGRALRSFSYLKSTANSTYTSGFYDTPSTWMAQMIVRGALVDDLDPMVQRLLMEGHFGDIDEMEYRKAWPKGTKIVQNKNCAAVKKAPKSLCGWVIPHYIQSKDPNEILFKAQDVFYTAQAKYDRAWDTYRAKAKNYPAVVKSLGND